MSKKILLLILLTIFFLLNSCILSLAEEEIEWDQELESKILGWGESVEVDGYVITAEDFNEDKLAFVSISKDGEDLERGPLSNGVYLTYNDEIKVYADEIKLNCETADDNPTFKTGKWDPTIQINVFLRGQPDIEITIDTEKDNYDPKSLNDRDINATITLKNVGEAKAEDLELVIETGKLELLDGKLKRSYYSIKKEETLEEINLLMDVPEPWENTDYYINVSVTGQDIKGKEFEWNESKSVEIKKKWDIIVSKSASREKYKKETVYLAVNIRNGGICPINDIKLMDFIDEKTYEKTLSLKAGESAANVIEYTFETEKPETYTFPKAVAAFTLPNGKYEEVESINTVETDIEGSYIVLKKKIDMQQVEVGDKLNVTLTATNKGNIYSSVTVSDTVPPEAKFISGDTGFKEILEEGESKTVTYMLQMNKKGKVQFPPAKANFLDLEDYSKQRKRLCKGEVYSEAPPMVYVGTPIEVDAKPGDTGPEGVTGAEQVKTNRTSDSASSGNVNLNPPAEEDTPGFGLIFAGLAIFGAVGLRKKRLL